MAKISSIDTIDNLRGTIVLDDFSGGLNKKDSNALLKDSEAIIRKNWVNEGKGSITKVSGHTKANSTTMGAKPVRGLFRVYQSDGTKELVAVCNGKMFYSEDSGATFTQETNAVALTETAFWSGVNYNDKFFCSSKSDNLYVYTPGSYALVASTGTPTDACQIILKRTDRRLLALVNSGNASTLYYSKVDPNGTDADDWSAASDAGSVAIDGAKSEGLTGGMTFGTTDIIFKHYAAFQVYGYPSPTVTRIPGSPGCVAPYSVAQGDGIGFHLAFDGVWMFNGNGFIKISDPIEDIIKSINSSYIQNSFGVYRNGFYWLFYTPSGQTTNQKCIIYDLNLSNPYTGKNVWFERDGLSMNCPCLFNGVGDANEIYAGGSASTGFVYRLDYSSTGADVTSNIEATYQTKYLNDKLPTLIKRFSKIRLRYFNSKGSLLVYYYLTRGAKVDNFSMSVTQTGVPLGSFTLGTDVLSEDVERLHIERLPDTAVGTDISLKFVHNDTGTPPIIREGEIDYEAMYQQEE